MKKLALTAVVLGVVSLSPALRADSDVSVPPLPGPVIRGDLQFPFPAIQEARLSNGIRVLFVERHDLPLFSVQIVSTVSAADVPPGVAELAARSAVWSASASFWMRNKRRFNLLGAKLRAYSGHASTGVSTHAMAPYLEGALDDLAYVARVEFPDSDIVRHERDLTVDSLEKAESSSATYAARALLYPPTHPYHYGEAGTAGAIRRIEPAPLRTFWARAFTASNVTIVASGDLTFDRLIKALETSFGSLPKGTAVVPSAPTASPLEAHKGVLLIDQPGQTQARVAVVAHGVGRSHPDFTGLSLTSQLLSGMLSRRIRKAYGSTYGVHASLETQRGTPPLWIHGSIENGSVGTGITTILGALADLRAGKTSPQFLERSRALAFQRTARAFETNTETTSLLASAAALGVSAEELRAIPKRLEAVTAEQIKDLATKHFDPARIRVVVLGDAKILGPELEKAGLGPIEQRGGPPKKPAANATPVAVSASPLR